MRKLNKNKVIWIIKQVEKGELSKWQIAKQQGITPQWLNKLFKKYKETGGLPVPGRPGRTPVSVIKEEFELVKSFKKEYGGGAVNLEKIMDEHKIHIPHNRIHEVLKMAGLAKNEKKKQGRCKWIRWERRHSNSLWHTDWYEYNGLHVIAYLDDASRLITGVGVFDEATAENAVMVLNQAIKDFGKPRQLLSDHGTQFTAEIFQKCLKQQVIEHIKARVKHPQTNGKMERWFSTLNQIVEHFKDFDYAIWFYNNKRPHMSLEKSDGKLVTPIQAFNQKKRRQKT